MEGGRIYSGDTGLIEFFYSKTAFPSWGFPVGSMPVFLWSEYYQHDKTTSVPPSRRLGVDATALSVVYGQHQRGGRSDMEGGRRA
jgi:hypothetical protein